MTPVKLKDGRWQVRVPKKISASGKRESKYFPAESKALAFVKQFKDDRAEHGRRAVTAVDKQWIDVLRTELGDLDVLREVLAHWRRTGRTVTPITAKDAVSRYLEFRSKDKMNPATRHDITWRLHAFATAFNETSLHHITSGHLEAFLQGHTAGWSRRSMYKRVLQFFSYAKRQRWIADDPFDDLDAPETPGGRKDIYTPAQFKALLDASVFADPAVCLYIALSGLAFMRSQELVRRFDNEPVLEWSDILWKRKLIHVREGVAKSARRKGENQRFPPIHPRLEYWLRMMAPQSEKRTGRIVDVSVRSFRKRIHAVHSAAGVPFKDNGLRKSAISYWLAGNIYGVGQVSEWAGNSEASVRAHYLKILTAEDHKAWFEAAE
jgi:integrase